MTGLFFAIYIRNRLEKLSITLGVSDIRFTNYLTVLAGVDAQF